MEDLSLEHLRLLAAAAARGEASAGTRERIWEILELLLDGQTPSDLDALLGSWDAEARPASAGVEARLGSAAIGSLARNVDNVWLAPRAVATSSE